MNRWFTKFAMMLLPSLAMSFAPLKAEYNAYDPCYDPCNPCADWCSGFEIGVDFIYWKPCIDGLDYAFQFDAPVLVTPLAASATGNYKYIDPSWEPGFRIFVAKEDVWSGWDLSASYTWIKVKERDSVTGATAGTLYSTQFNPGAVPNASYTDLASRYRLNYQTFDVLLSTDCCICEGSMVKPYFGITGVFLDQKIDTSGTTSDTVPLVNDLRWRNDYWGIGFKVGTEYKYTFCDGFQFFANASGSIVAGEDDTRRTDRAAVTTAPVALSARDDEQCHFLNGYHIQSGFLYEDCWCNWDFAFRIGYEFVKWHNVSTVRRHQQPAAAVAQVATSASPTTTTIGFHGLFAGLSFGF